MKVYFSATTSEYDLYRDNYYAIRNYILEQGHILTRDWLPLTDERIKNKQIELNDIKEIYKLNIDGIKNSDAVIIEDTISNFSTGHQITIALQMKKPTLVLWKGKKHRKFKQMFIHGIESDILEVNEYNENDFKEKIKVFLNKYENSHEKTRFNLVLNNFERDYLDWAQFVKEKSRTKVIREALKKVIDKDKEYEEYLKNKNI